MNWTDKNVATLKRMWLDHSASEIAACLDGVISRNAVIGKAARLGLEKATGPSAPAGARKSKPVHLGGADTKSIRNRRVNAQLRVIASAQVVTAAPATQPPKVIETPTATLVGLDRRACKWPIGDPGADGFGFCGRSATGTYCDQHARVAYRAQPLADKTVKPNGKLPLWARS